MKHEWLIFAVLLFFVLVASLISLATIVHGHAMIGAFGWTLILTSSASVTFLLLHSQN